MLSDLEIQRLNESVASALAAGKHGEEALSTLNAYLQDSVIRGEYLVWATCESTESLPDHVFLGRIPSEYASNLHSVVSGCGEHYNGMYGADCSMLRDPEAARRIGNENRPQGTIAERVVSCVHLLNSSRGSLMHEHAAALRHHLSTLLLENPVLLHPNFVIPCYRGSNIEYTSIASALASTPHGGLPRYTHFLEYHPRGDARRDDSLDRILTGFARHPCVRLAIEKASPRVRADMSQMTARQRAPKFGRESLLRSLLHATGSRVEFLASIMELEDLGRTRSSGSLPGPFYAYAAKGSPLRRQLDALLASSTCAASGEIHTISVLGTLPASMRVHARDAAFLDGIRARSAELFVPNSADSGFGTALQQSLQRRVFAKGQTELPVGDVVHNVHAIMGALVKSGFSKDAPEAARFLIDATVGMHRPDGRLPGVDAGLAVHFLKSLDDLGSLGLTDKEVVENVSALQRTIKEHPPHKIPYRDSWETACQVYVNERNMKAAMKGFPLGLNIQAAETATSPQASARARAAL